MTQMEREIGLLWAWSLFYNNSTVLLCYNLMECGTVPERHSMRRLYVEF